MRIYQLAKELGLDSKLLMDKLRELNFPVKSHMSVVDADTAEVIKHEISDLRKKEIEENVIEVEFPITLKDLAVKLGKKPSEIISVLIKKGKFVNINHSFDEKTAKELAYQYKVNLKAQRSREDQILQTESKGKMVSRAPVVTLMGHIDHGKTSILDYIRKSRITKKESGGITQHTGAYQVDCAKKGKITFLDTPGHETFTAMRARGAEITDMVILVVAADEGVKPQTEEAYSHAKAAGVPIMVAINKIDRPNADVDMCKQHLSKLGLVPEDWGGETITVNVSAKTGEGIDDLLEMILLQSEMMELKADGERKGLGTVVEARLSKGRGSLAAILVQAGYIRVGDICVCGQAWGRIKAMHDDRGAKLKEAGPATPVEILGLNAVPSPGDQCFIVPDEASAKEIVETRMEKEKLAAQTAPAHMKLEDLYSKVKDEEVKQLKLILKADVGGTLEAVVSALNKLSTSEVALEIVHKGVGSVISSDVLLAEVSDAVIVGFKAAADASVKDLARSKGIEIRNYQIIYELIDDIRAAMEGMLTPEVRRIFLGRAKVQKVFKLSRGVIAGCIVEKGKIQRDAKFQLIRNNDVVFESKLNSLKRFKDDVREVNEGMECGISLNYSNIQQGDLIDVFLEESIKRKLK